MWQQAHLQNHYQLAHYIHAFSACMCTASMYTFSLALATSPSIMWGDVTRVDWLVGPTVFKIYV